MLQVRQLSLVNLGSARSLAHMLIGRRKGKGVQLHADVYDVSDDDGGDGLLQFQLSWHPHRRPECFNVKAPSPPSPSTLGGGALSFM